MPLLMKKVLIALAICSIIVVILCVSLGINWKNNHTPTKNYTETTITTTTTTTTRAEWMTTYSSALTDTSPMYCPALYCDVLHYYEAIKIRVTVTGAYDIFSTDNIDSYGFLYNQTFYPRYVNYNAIVEDDNGNDYLQFRLTAYLQEGETYILVVTTYRENTTGAFIIGDEGPASLLYQKTNATIPNYTFIYSNYSSSLSRSVPRFCARDRCISGSYNYQALVLNVTVPGVYKITSRSSLDMVGYIYHTQFNSNDTYMNLMTSDDFSGLYNQFSLEVFLDTVTRYILIPTTFRPNISGPYAIWTEGPGGIQYTLL